MTLEGEHLQYWINRYRSKEYSYVEKQSITLCEMASDFQLSIYADMDITGPTSNEFFFTPRYAQAIISIRKYIAEATRDVDPDLNFKELLEVL